MTSVVPRSSITVAPDKLEQVTALYDQGLYLQAYRLAEEIGPLRDWDGAAARLLAGRLAGNLGGGRLAEALFIRAWRQEPEHPEACWFYGRYLLDARGPWQALRFVTHRDPLGEASRESRSNWLALHGTILGRVRDFDAAEKWLRQAEALGDDLPWIYLERAALRSLEDRHEEALAAARTALEVRPWYRPAVQWLAHFLVQKEQDADALQLLSEAAQRLESAAIVAQLANLQMEMGLHTEARQSLVEFARLAPLLDKHMAQWLAARRCDAAYYCGDLDKSLEYARQVKTGFFEAHVKRLEHPPAERRRVCLTVGFVRQHHQTCAPATLAAICRFWSMPGAHLEMAAAITYAGTPWHAERRWAMDHGWHTREFTVTWDSAVALVDRGIPFTLTTSELASSHLQAVIGYDSLRGTLILRDPGERHQTEVIAEGLFERYASTGPRGLALVPLAQKERLESLTLPDSELFDELFALEKALAVHDRTVAEQQCRKLETQAQGHRLALLARRTLAVYDVNTPQILEVTDRLIAQYPEDLRWQLARVQCLRTLAHRDEYMALLKRLSEQPKTDPACWQQYAQELADDAREHRRALRLLDRSIRCNPLDARTYYLMAEICWGQRRFQDALDLHRMAACIEDTEEHLARSYFLAANRLGKSEEALMFLQQRFERFGKKSGQPARTLSWAYFQLERTSEGYSVLDQGLALRPDDGDLLLYALDQRVQHGNFGEARRLFMRARGKSQKTAWLRSGAALTAAEGKLDLAAEAWAKVLNSEPLAADAHAAYTRLLAETKGRAAALEHLHEVVARFPCNFQLKQLLVDWLREDGPQAIEPVVRSMIDIHPADAWARRELALVLADQNRLDEAFAALAEAQRLEPHCTSYYMVHARLLTLAGQGDEAKHALREALSISIDLEQAVYEWMAACESQDERREALGFIQEELVLQVSSGPGLLTFRDAALSTLEADELLVALRTAREARPDLWQAWAAVILQLQAMEQFDEALEMAQEALAHFPLLPELWVDLAEVYQARKEEEQAVKALRKAMQIAPGWSEALRRLSDLYQRRGQADEAKLLVGRAIARAPLQAANHFTLAMLLWTGGERGLALERMQHAVELDPGYERAWDYLCDWAAEMGRFQTVVDLARTLTGKRPGEVRAWLRLAQALMRMPGRVEVSRQDCVDECLEALGRVHQLAPRLAEAYDMEAQVLAEAGRHEQAEAACQAPIWKGRPPITLRGRLAWLVAQRGDLPGAIEQMRAILKDDPAYYWGWTKLVEWYQASGHHQNCLSAAQQMIRLAPQSPEAWAYRGEAKLSLGDRKGGKKDLRRACDLAPDYAFAALKLFDEHLADQELRHARRTLRRLYQTVRDDFVKARLVQWFALRKKARQATRAFMQLCRSPNPVSWPLEAAARAMAEAGWQGRVELMYRKVLGEACWNPNVAVCWAESFDRDVHDDLEERLEALDEALPRFQDVLRPLDLKAELLSKAGRFGEALAICQDPAVADAIPLRGRAAWIEWQRGRQADAAARMQAVVAGDPSYYWGWSQLADWCAELDRPEDHLQAAEKMVALAPDNPVAFVHRAQARRRLDDLSGAKEDFRQAVDMAPDFTFAATQLLGLYLDAGEIEAAERLLEAMQPSASAADIALASIRLAQAKGEAASAVGHLEQLCKAGEDQADLLQQGVQVLEEADLPNEVAWVLVKFLGAGAVVAEQWVALAERQGWLAGVAKEIGQMSSKKPGKRHAVVAFAGALSKAKQVRQLQAWVDKHRELLRKDTHSWGMIGHSFSAVFDDRATAAWLDDWQTRDDAQAWMLLNLALALRGLGRFAEAGRVSQFAVGEMVPDYTSRFHQLWLILDEALAGNAEAVRTYFDHHVVGEFDSNHQWIATLAQVLLVTQTMKNKSAAFAEARRLLGAAARSLEPIDRDQVFEIAYKRTVARVAGNCGGVRAKMWGWWHCRKPLLPRRKAAVL